MKPKYCILRNEAAPEGGDQGGGGAPAAPIEAPPVHFNPDGTLGEKWHTALGDEFSPHAAALAPFKDVKSLAKSYLHFRSTGPAYPGEAATPEDVTRYHALAQVPAEGTPTAYGITLPDGASDLDKSVIDRLAKVAHSSHLSGPGFKAVVAEYQKIQQEEGQKLADAEVAAQKAAEDALIGEWRGNFEANKSTVRHLAGTLAAQAGIDPSDPQFAAMVNTPAFSKMMLEVAKLTREDGIRAPAGMGDLRSPQQVADAIMDGSDPVWGKKYREGTQAEQLAAYDEVVRLMKQAAA